MVVGEINHCTVILHHGKNQKTLHPRDYVHNTVTNILFLPGQREYQCHIPLSNLIKKMHFRIYLSFNLLLKNVEVKPTVLVIYITIFQIITFCMWPKKIRMLYTYLFWVRESQRQKTCLTCLPQRYIHNNIINIPKIRK